MPFIRDSAWYQRVRDRFVPLEADLIERGDINPRKRALVIAVMLERGFQIGEGGAPPPPELEIAEDILLFQKYYNAESS